MKKIAQSIMFWLKAARIHSLPMAVMSWAVVFCFALKDGGNAFLGVLALVGILFAQLGVNLGDDYMDFKRDAQTIKANQKGKCEYLLQGKTTINTVFGVVIFYFTVAFVIGLYLTLVCGWQAAAIAFVAGILCLLYPKLTYIGLGEAAVALTFAPLLFLGTYFVMTGSYSLTPLAISVSTGILTVVLLHVHTLMDFDFDIKENKKTLCAMLKSKEKSLHALGAMLILAYLNIAVLTALKIIEPKFLLTFLSLPMALGLYKLMKAYVENPQAPVCKKFWMGPIEYWSDIEKNSAQNFMIRFYLARNLMTAFSLLVCAAVFI